MVVLSFLKKIAYKISKENLIPSLGSLKEIFQEKKARGRIFSQAGNELGTSLFLDRNELLTGYPLTYTSCIAKNELHNDFSLYLVSS